METSSPLAFYGGIFFPMPYTCIGAPRVFCCPRTGIREINNLKQPLLDVALSLDESILRIPYDFKDRMELGCTLDIRFFVFVEDYGS